MRQQFVARLPDGGGPPWIGQSSKMRKASGVPAVWLAYAVVIVAFIFSIVVLSTDFGGDHGDNAANVTLGAILAAAILGVWPKGTPSTNPLAGGTDAGSGRSPSTQPPTP